MTTYGWKFTFQAFCYQGDPVKLHIVVIHALSLLEAKAHLHYSGYHSEILMSEEEN